MTSKVRKFPKGSEVIMTSVNLPDMVRMVKEHGLIPVPLDLDPRTMGPISVEKMRELVTPQVGKNRLITIDKMFHCSLHLWSEVWPDTLRWSLRGDWNWLRWGCRLDLFRCSWLDWIPKSRSVHVFVWVDKGLDDNHGWSGRRTRSGIIRRNGQSAKDLPDLYQQRFLHQNRQSSCCQVSLRY